MNLLKRLLSFILFISITFSLFMAFGIVKVNAKLSYSYERVTSVDTLKAGGTFIIGYEATANSGVIVPMGNTGTATTSAAGIIYSGNPVSYSGKGTLDMTTYDGEGLNFCVNIQTSTINANNVTIKIKDNYIGNANTKNNCKLFSEDIAANGTSLEPSIGTNDVITLKNGNASYHTFQYNSSSPRFAFYGGAQKNLVIYKQIIHNDEPTISFTDKTSNVVISSEIFSTTFEQCENGTVSLSYIKDSIETPINDTESFNVYGKMTLVAKLYDSSNNLVASTTKEVVIFPDNSQLVSVSEVIEICEILQDAELETSPIKYKMKSTITEKVSTPKYKFTEQNEELPTSSIVVYEKGSNRNENELVYVEGYPKLVVSGEETTYEFHTSLAKGIYTVVFDSNNGNENQVFTDLEEGSLLVEPQNITKENYTLMGWKILDNGNDWDFENDEVIRNITLKAFWLSDSLAKIQNGLNTVKSYMSMAFRYESVNSKEKSYVKVTDSSSLKVGDKIYITSSEAEPMYSFGSENSNNFSAITIDFNNLSNNPKQFTLYEGNQDGTFAIGYDDAGTTKYLYSASSSSNYLRANTSIDNNASWKIEITSKGVASIVSQGDKSRRVMQFNSSSNLFSCYGDASQKPISIYIESETKDYSNSDFVLNCGIGVFDDFNDDANLSVEYGIEVKTSSKTLKTILDHDNETIMFTENINYLLIDLGDVFKYTERANVVFEVRAFAEVHDNENNEDYTYYSSEVKHYSLKELIYHYDTNVELSEEHKALVQDILRAFNTLGIN